MRGRAGRAGPPAGWPRRGRWPWSAPTWPRWSPTTGRPAASPTAARTGRATAPGCGAAATSRGAWTWPPPRPGGPPSSVAPTRSAWSSTPAGSPRSSAYAASPCCPTWPPTRPSWPAGSAGALGLLVTPPRRAELLRTVLRPRLADVARPAPVVPPRTASGSSEQARLIQRGCEPVATLSWVTWTRCSRAGRTSRPVTTPGRRPGSPTAC